MLFLIQPLVIGAVSDAYELTHRQIGWFASSDLYGSALAAFVAGFWITRVSPLIPIVGGLICFILGNLITLGSPSFDALLLVRMFCGAGAGTVVSVATVILGRHQSPAFVFGVGIAGRSFVSTIALFALPTPIASFGFQAAYWFLIGVAVIAFVFGSAIRSWGLDVSATQEESARRDDRQNFEGANNRRGALLSIFGLLSSLFLLTAVAAVWAYSQPIAKESGIDLEFVGFAAGLAGVSAVLASLVASVTGRKGTLRLQLVASITILLGATACLQPGVSPLLFAVAIFIFKGAYCFVIALQMAIVAFVDRSGRFLAVLPSFQILGSAIGPSLVALAMTAGDLSMVTVIAGSMLAATLLSILLPARVTDTGGRLASRAALGAGGAGT